MPKFRSKPVVIEAFHFTGDLNAAFAWASTMPDAIAARTSGTQPKTYLTFTPWPDDKELFAVHTLEGDMTIAVGDWIICGLLGELYPCTPKVFEAKYERIEE